ncbi:MAG: VOC family protein [Pleurocapsa sp. MO_226.B13]|nr:VOC family protein [Pleurocapsa sp. MO_226.B13]
MNITHCLHTAILVSDLAKAADFYGNTLGLSDCANRTAKFPGTWYQIGNHQIHLIVHQDYVSELYNREKWGRNPHLALTVDNLELAKTTLQDRGYPIQLSASGRAALFTQDPDGNIIELSQAG